MDVAQIEAFLEAARGGNFARAAEAVHLSAPAFTRSIARLEAELGAKLFQRGPAGAVLTEFGERFQIRAAAICAELRLARYELRDMADASDGHVRIGASTRMAAWFLPGAIERHLRRFPGVTVSIVEVDAAHLVTQLASGDFDLGVAFVIPGLRRDPDLTYRSLFQARDSLVVRSGHPLMGTGPVPLQALATFPWIVPDRLRDLREQIAARFIEAGVEPPSVRLRSDSGHFIKQMLLRTDHISMLGRDFVQNEISAGLLAILPSDAFPADMIGAVLHRNRSQLSPAATRLYETIVAAAAEDLSAQGLTPL